MRTNSPAATKSAYQIDCLSSHIIRSTSQRLNQLSHLSPRLFSAPAGGRQKPAIIFFLTPSAVGHLNNQLSTNCLAISQLIARPSLNNQLSTINSILNVSRSK